MARERTGKKVIASNRRARHDYAIVDEIEAGIVLSGSEVKSLREGHVQIADAYARIINGQVWLDGMHLPIINHLPESLERTGARAACRTDEGLFDMVGNLHEWIADADGTFRGGYYMDTTQNGEGCGYQTTAHSFDYHDYSTGFRCCADPEELE